MKKLEDVWFGTGGSWLIQYSDGSSAWVGFPLEISKLLQKNSADILFLAYSCEDYYIKYPDYSYWSVEDPELGDYLNDGIESVQFGNSGCECYFVVSSDGQTVWNNLPDPIQNEILQNSHRGVSMMNFAEDEDNLTYFIMFDDDFYVWFSEDKYFNQAIEEADEHGGVDFVRLAPDNPLIHFVRYRDGTSVWKVSEEFSRAASCAIFVKTSLIRYTRDSISPWFRSGRSVEQLVKELVTGTVSVFEIPYIECYLDEKGIWWSNNNKRLWAYKEAGMDEIPVIRVNRVKTRRVFDEGRSIEFRSDEEYF
ncbi:hypothetical protein HK098_003466 [Nowakowskiella sp. JEL0407]|nr:hypothetical protein HK098_003466 [Nowakowskiella sp. JEL0407]